MVRRGLHIIFLFAALILGACDKIYVHEFPGEDPVDPTIVNVTLHIHACEDYKFRDDVKEPVYTENWFYEPDRTARFIIEVNVDENFSQELVYREVFVTTEKKMKEEIVRTLPLHALNYKVSVWQDLTDPDNPESDVWYRTDPLNAVKIQESSIYVGGHDTKQVSSFTEGFNLHEYADKWNVELDIPFQLIRPQSKYIIVSTDVAKFVKSYNANYSTQGEMTAEEIFEQCTMKVSYNGFLPNGYNVKTGLLNDSQGGYGYNFAVTLINDNQAIVAYDYVLTVPDTAVNLALNLYDSNGVLVNTVSTLNVPISRNKITVIRGEYLTREYGGGVGIDPGFDGEFNIIIP